MRHKPVSRLAVEDVLARFKGQPLTELEAAYRLQVEDVQRIQEQLSYKDKQHPDGTRFTAHEYHEWRGRAIGALRHKIEEQRVFKEAMKISRRRFNTDTPLRPATTLKTADELIHAALVLLRRILSEVEDPETLINDEEQQIVRALDTYLRTHGKVGA